MGLPTAILNPEQIEGLKRYRSKVATGQYHFEEVPCICNKHDGILVARFDRYSLPVDTRLCRSCGVMWSSSRMTNETLVRFYKEDYSQIYNGNMTAQEYFFADQIKHGRQILNYVRSSIGTRVPATVFDVGCGAGGTLVPFRDADCKVFGCDFGDDYLRRGEASGLHLVEGDVRALAPYAPADLIILSHVLELCTDPKFTIESIASVLSEDGIVYIELPGIFRIHETYKDTLLYLQIAHLYHFTLASLSCLMAKAGFELIQGDELIRAIYRRKRNHSVDIQSTNYRKILLYLCIIEYLNLSKLAELPRRVRNLISAGAKKLLGPTLTAKVRQLASDVRVRHKR